jgi:putative transposase
MEQFGKPVSHSIPTIVRAYKSAVTYAVNALQDQRGAALWQRNYHERIIRSEQAYENIYRYILSNPLKWGNDDKT